MIGCYLRVSSKEQNLDSQRLAIDRWLENHGIVVHRNHWYVDDGVSGKTLDRPGFNRLRQAIFDGDIDTVVIYKLDRIARRLVEGITTLAEWLDAGVRVVAVAQQMDYAGPTGKLIASVLFGLAEIERETLRERQADGIEAARAVQDRAKKMHANGADLHLITCVLDRPFEIVKRMLAAPPGKLWWGQEPTDDNPRTRKIFRRDLRIRRLVRRGLTTQEVANALNCSRRTVVARLSTMGGYKKIRAVNSGEKGS